MKSKPTVYELKLFQDNSEAICYVNSFEYTGVVNGVYEVEFDCFGEFEIDVVKDLRFSFGYGGKTLADGSINGYVKKLSKGYDNKLDRWSYKITGVSVIGLFAEYHINKSFHNATSLSVLTNLVGLLPHSSVVNHGQFDLLASQSNYNQLLNSNVLEFFNYQFNLLGFYVVDSSPKADVINIYSQPRDLVNSQSSYDLTVKDQSNVLYSVSSFKKLSKRQKQSLDLYGYDIHDNADKRYPSSTSLSGGINSEQQSHYDKNYKIADEKVLSARKNSSIHSLDNIYELKGTNLFHREGDVLELSAKRYWVYKSELKGVLD
jgi:hypothetical protein